MSHIPERKEKDCLNCGTIVQGRYCQVCGQENVVPKESFSHLVLHFFYDITHFDSKFFHSVWYLISRPGFLSKEYIKGRRASYLNPIRMYVFTSAIFFLIFFAVNDVEKGIKLSGNDPYTLAQRDSIINSIREDLKKDPKDADLEAQLLILLDTSKQVRPTDLLPYTNSTVVGTMGGKYKNRKEYDSIQKGLPKNKQDGWFRRLWNRKAIGINEKYKSDPSASFEKLSELVVHRIPYLLFVSLPFFALILKLLYWRRRSFYYADHGIFTVHHYIFSFILLLFVFLVDLLHDSTGWGIWSILKTIVFIAWPVYLYIAMKKFYQQGAFKTFLKFVLLIILALIVVSLLFAFFLLFSVIQL